MTTSCKNCMYWYAEDRWSPPICHGSTDDDCDMGQMDLEWTTLHGVYGLNEEQISRLKKLRSDPEVQELLEKIENGD